VVIVNYNSGSYLARCIPSLLGQSSERVEIIVVDNASTDASLAILQTYPEVRLIRNCANRGFAAAQNQGIRASSGSYVMALNFDIELDPLFISSLVSALESHPEAGWASGRLLQMTPEGRRQDRLYSAGQVLPRNRFALLRGFGERDEGQYAAGYVFGAPGAAVLYRREFIEDITLDGQFYDERLFTWYEDVDVDWRGQLRGWKCLYVPEAVAYHVGHVGEAYSEPFRSFRAQMTIRNRWLVIAANETLAGLLRTLPWLMVYEASLVLYVVRVGLVHAYLRAMKESLLSGKYIRRKRSLVHRRREIAPVGRV
jgi:GT2 family glycosyltransferase